MIELNTTDLYRVGNDVVRLNAIKIKAYATTAPYSYYEMVEEKQKTWWIDTPRITYQTELDVPRFLGYGEIVADQINSVYRDGVLGLAFDNCPNVTLHGCIVRDIIPIGPPGSLGTPHAQGLWCRKADILTIKDSVFYNIGYDCHNPVTMPPSRFNHGVYADSTVKETVIENCWFINCSNFGIKAQGGKIRIKNCVFFECAGAIECGREDPALYPGMPMPSPCDVETESIVVIRARAISENRQNWGVYLMNTERAVIKNVIMVESLDNTGRPVIQNNFVDEEHGYFGCRNVTRENVWVDTTSPLETMQCKRLTGINPIAKVPIDVLINRPANEYDYNVHDAATFITKFAKECGAW